MSTTDDNRDLLRHADVGTTVTHRESKTLHSINYTPSSYFGSDRLVGDIDIVDVELIETDDNSCGPDIKVTWEGEVTKKLPPRWDRHTEPRTDTERRRDRRRRWGGIAIRVVAFFAPLVAAFWLTMETMERLAGSMTIKGEPLAVPPTTDIVVMFGLFGGLAAIIFWGLNGGFPGRVAR